MGRMDGLFTAERIEPHNLVHIQFKEPQWQNWGWIRIQEFYESPDKHVRGLHNTIEHLVERELKENNAFSYLEDWDGFNVPGHVWDLFTRPASTLEYEVACHIMPHLFATLRAVAQLAAFFWRPNLD